MNIEKACAAPRSHHPTVQSRAPFGSSCSLLVALAFSLACGVLVSVPGVAFPEEYALPIPAEVSPPPIPNDNPLSAAKVELGQKLYFDPRLSVDNTTSCATCHDPRKGFADGKPVAEGVKQQKGTRNSPSVLNAAYYEQQFWDGRAAMLEDQAVLPITNPTEMAMPSHGAVEDKLRKLPEYPPLFQKAFGKPEITIRRIGQAIASFERTLVSFSAPFDRFIKGDKTAISESAQRGWVLFNGKARCNTCHGYVNTVPIFSDNKYHNIGVGAKQRNFLDLAREAQQALQKSDPVAIDALATKSHVGELGRFLITKDPKDFGAFKTSGLRNIELTAPYMHDGSEATLLDVINFYDRGGESNPFLDGDMRPLGLNDRQKADLVELMKTFTSDDLQRFEALNSLMPAQ